MTIIIFPQKRIKQMNFIQQMYCNLIELLYSSCFHLWVDTEVFSWGKGQSQEVVAFSSLLGVILQQLPQLLHNLQKAEEIYKIFRKYILETDLFLYQAEKKQWKTSCDFPYRSNQLLLPYVFHCDSGWLTFSISGTVLEQ